MDQKTADLIGSARLRRRLLEHGDLIYSIGSRVEHGFTLFDGYAIAYRILGDGSRQVTRFILPGDLMFLENSSEVCWSDSAEVIGGATLCVFSGAALGRLFQTSLPVAQTLALIHEADEEILYEHLTDLGRRSSRDRVARLLLEIFHRQRQRGREEDGRCYFPFTQEQLGDALGLSGAHVNRVHGLLKDEGLMHAARRWLVIPDFDAAAKLFEYEPLYLHRRPVV